MSFLFILILLQVRYFIPMAPFKIFLLSLVFSSLNMIYLGAHFLVFIRVCILWIYSVMSVVNFGKFSAIIESDIFSVTFSLLLLLLSQLHVWCTICNHISLEYYSHFSSLLICISFWEVFTDNQAHWFFYWPYSFFSWAHQSIFLFILQSFDL